jgi:hypothetical protein
LPERRWLFVPLWGIPTWFCYAPRRVECAEHGVVVEHIPWSDGNRPVTCAMMGFLARWARRLNWQETARVFQTSWEAVYRSVEWFVQWGLTHRQLSGVESIGVDEVHWAHGLRADNFLTVIYQIDACCRRLLWVGKRRTQATLRRGLRALGPEVVKGLRFVCSDMWKPYLRVIAAQAGHALLVLDRFHITSHLNQAVKRGAPGREPALARQRQGGRRAAQAYALASVTPRQPGPRSRAAKAQCTARQQNRCRARVGAERNLSTLLELQVHHLDRRLPRLQVLPGYAEPSGTDEKGSPCCALTRN